MLKWQKKLYFYTGHGNNGGGDGYDDDGKVNYSQLYYLVNNMRMSIFELE